MAFLNLKQKLISFVYRPVCCFCDLPIDRENQNDASVDQPKTAACDPCYSEVVGSTIDRCYFCGADSHPLNPFGSQCRACLNWKSPIERAISLGKYQHQLKRTIVEIKRECSDVKAYQLGSLLGSISDKFDFPSDIDFVIPVPSHWRRRFSRNGFHVTDVIADGFCQATGLGKVNKALKCVRLVKKQAKLRPGQRIKNVRGTFVVNQRANVREKRILLLDDVMTSGATINECTKMLLNAGAKSIFVAVTARATGNM